MGASLSGLPLLRHCVCGCSVCSHFLLYCLQVMSRNLSTFLLLCPCYTEQAAKQPAFVQTSADIPAETNVKCQCTSKIYSMLTFQAGQLFTAKNTSVCRGAKPKSVLQAGPTHMKTFLACAAGPTRPLPAHKSQPDVSLCCQVD